MAKHCRDLKILKYNLIFPPSLYDMTCNNLHVFCDWYRVVEASWNVMAHAQIPEFFFRAKRTMQFKSAGGVSSVDYWPIEVCASVVVMLDTPCSEVVWRVWLPTAFASFPFTSPPVRHRVPSQATFTTASESCMSSFKCCCHPHDHHKSYPAFSASSRMQSL